MTRCTNCNNELQPNSQFCSRCGAPANQLIQSIAGFPCPGCGGNNPYGSVNCTVCGRPLPPTTWTAPILGITCPSCGAPNYPDTPYCMSCGRALPINTFTYNQALGGTKQSRNSRHVLIFTTIALVLVIAMVVGFWKPGYIWKLIDNGPLNTGQSDTTGKKPKNGTPSAKSNPESSGVLSETWLEEYSSKDPNTNPGPMPISGTKAFSVSPAEGLTISAEDNALDKDRKITAEKLDDEAIINLIQQHSDADWLLLGGYELHAGLNSDQRFPGMIKVDMDLSKLNITEELWEHTQIVRIGDDGLVSMLPSDVNGSTLSCFTSQNSIIAAVIVGLTGGVAVQYLIEQGHVGLNDLYVDVEFCHTTIKAENSSYDIYWPETMMSTTVKQFQDKEASLRKKHGLNPNGTLNAASLEATKNFSNAFEMMGFMDGLKKAYFSDPEYIELAKDMKNINWNKENYWPAEVSQTIDAIKMADRYLFGKRNFNCPGYNVDIVVLDKWPSNHGDPSTTLGISMNLYTLRPFIHINASSRQSKIPRSSSETKSAATSNLLITVTHELFHVAQSRYVRWDMDKYTVFWEALAISLEREAFNYYSSSEGDNIIDPANTTLLTDRGFYQKLLKHSLLTPSLWNNDNEDQSFIRDHGYTASNWIDFLRDRYYSGNPDDFLPQLMSRFSGSAPAGGETFNRILREQTSNDTDPSFGQPYSEDFIAFCQTKYTDFYRAIQYTSPPIKDILLNAEHPVAELTIKWQPLSTTLQDFRIDSKGVDGKPRDYRIVIKDRLDWDNYYITRNFLTSIQKVTVEVDEDLVMLPQDNSSLLTLMEIQAQNEDLPAEVESGTYRIFMLRQPEKPEIIIDEEFLVITPPDWSIPDPRELLSGYDIVITGPGGAEYRHVSEISLAEVEIPLADIKPKDKSKESDKDDEKYTAFIVERIDLPDGTSIYGADGEIAELGDELRFEDIIGEWDMVQTVSNFKSPFMDELKSQMEGAEGMEEYLEQYNQYYQNVDGTYTGTMKINKTGTNTASVGFHTSNSGNESTVLYNGVWDEGILHLTPSGAVLGGNWNLNFKKKKNVVTCEGESIFEDVQASYSYTITATKKN